MRVSIIRRMGLKAIGCMTLAVLWLNPIQAEDSLGDYKLPDGATGYVFGRQEEFSGFISIKGADAFDEQGPGFTAKNINESGKYYKGQYDFPDPLTGSGVWAHDKFAFRARIPSGKYRVWLCAGRVIRGNKAKPSRNFLLKVQGQTLIEEVVSEKDYLGERHMFRFLQAHDSPRAESLWREYIDKFNPEFFCDIEIKDGVLEVEVELMNIRTLVLIPKEKGAELDAAVKKWRIQRQKDFQARWCEAIDLSVAGKEKLRLFVPDESHNIQPASRPRPSELERKKLTAFAAPGQSLVMRVAALPGMDLGKGELKLSDLKSDSGSVIPASVIHNYIKLYRCNGKETSERALLPNLAWPLDKGIAREWWLWAKIPGKQKSGLYKGKVSVVCEKGVTRTLPLEIEVLPVSLTKDLPYSLGLYYQFLYHPALPKDLQIPKASEHFKLMRRLGMTAIHLGERQYAPKVVDVGHDGEVEVKYDSTLLKLAKEAGMGRHPEQYSMLPGLYTARQIASKLRIHIGKSPGVELVHENFIETFKTSLEQLQEHIESSPIPLMVETVDEPRERSLNAWNRTIDDTITYARLYQDAMVSPTYVTPMRDASNRVSTLPLVDDHDIVATHGWVQSKRLIQQVQRAKKTLYLYNTGKDRYTWGFYNWRLGSKGRWEWHFCWAFGTYVVSTGNNPWNDWFNPFSLAGASIHNIFLQAPLSYEGAVIFRSNALQIMQGINDMNYLHTLESLLKKKKSRPAAKAARKFLNSLKPKIEEFPKKVKGLRGGAELGSGIGKPEVINSLPNWRREIARHIIALQ